MSEAIAVALIAALAAVLVELIRGRRRATTEHAQQVGSLASLTEAVKENTRDLGGMKSDLRHIRGEIARAHARIDHREQED